MTRFFEKNGWTQVPRGSKEHSGFDLLFAKGSEELRIEVKGTEKPYCGIPDLYDTQVDRSRQLVADYLCVGYFPPGDVEKLAIIPRSDLPPDALETKTCYRIKSAYKSPKWVSQRLRNLDEPWQQ